VLASRADTAGVAGDGDAALFTPLLVNGGDDDTPTRRDRGLPLVAPPDAPTPLRGTDLLLRAAGDVALGDRPCGDAGADAGNLLLPLSPASSAAFSSSSSWKAWRWCCCIAEFGDMSDVGER
jgi:hypothetical protein